MCGLHLRVLHLLLHGFLLHVRLLHLLLHGFCCSVQGLGFVLCAVYDVDTPRAFDAMLCTLRTRLLVLPLPDLLIEVLNTTGLLPQRYADCLCCPHTRYAVVSCCYLGALLTGRFLLSGIV